MAKLHYPSGLILGYVLLLTWKVTSLVSLRSSSMATCIPKPASGLTLGSDNRSVERTKKLPWKVWSAKPVIIARIRFLVWGKRKNCKWRGYALQYVHAFLAELGLRLSRDSSTNREGASNQIVITLIFIFPKIEGAQAPLVGSVGITSDTFRWFLE